MQRVEVQTHDRSRVPAIHIVLIQSCFRACAVLSVRLVHISLFRADPERRCLVVGEVERGYRDFRRFVMSGVLEFQCFLATCVNTFLFTKCVKQDKLEVGRACRLANCKPFRLYC